MTDIDTTAAARPRGLKWVFVGSNGLRAGWGVLLFVLIAVALVIGLRFALLAVFHGQKHDMNTLAPNFMLIVEAVQTAIVLIPTLIVALIERRSLVKLGFGLRKAGVRLFQGLAVGAAAMAGLAGLLYLMGAIHFGAIALHGADVWRYGAEWGGVFLLVGVSEELLFRGYLQQTVARGLNFRWAALILGVLFTVAHMTNDGESPIGLLAVFVVALVFSYAVWRTGTLWWGIGFHAAWDWMQSFVFGVADSGHPAVDALMTSKPAGPDWLSGGSTGPEGSVLSLAVLVVVALIIHLTLKRPDEDLGVKG